MWIPLELCDCVVKIWMHIKITLSLFVSKVKALKKVWKV